MDKLFCKPFTNQITSTYRDKVEGCVRVFEDKEPPTLNHICSQDGLWILPEQTVESVRDQRKARYSAETDELKEHIKSDEMLGKPAIEIEQKLAVWRDKVNQIKQDLPIPEEKQVTSIPSHYQSLLPPSPTTEELPTEPL